MTAPGDEASGAHSGADAGGSPDGTGASAEADVSARLSAAAQASAFGKAADAGVTPRVILAAMGGWRGVAEALTPGVVFLVLYLSTRSLILAVTAPAVLGVAALVIRWVRREPVAGAFAGLIGVLVSGLIAVATGEGVDYYVLGLWTNLVYGAVILLTMLLGWPVVGIVAGFALGIGTQWRRHRRAMWWMQALTLVWVGLFAARLAVQLPLYQAHEAGALGAARLLMGVPLFAVVLVVTAVLARSALRRSGLPSSDGSANMS